MSDLVVTNIRLQKAELMEYRQLALSMGKSFSEFTRIALAEKAREAYLGKKDGTKNHDKYIYSIA